MAKFNLKDIALAIIFSYIFITVLNYVAHQAFNLPILKTGVAILIFLIGIILSCLFVFIQDGKLDSGDVKGLLIVTALVIGIYFGVRYALPDLFAVAPNGLKETFSIFDNIKEVFSIFG